MMAQRLMVSISGKSSQGIISILLRTKIIAVVKMKMPLLLLIALLRPVGILNAQSAILIGKHEQNSLSYYKSNNLNYIISHEILAYKKPEIIRTITIAYMSCLY